MPTDLEQAEAAGLDFFAEMLESNGSWPEIFAKRLGRLILEQRAQEAEKWRDLTFARGEVLKCDRLMRLGVRMKRHAESLRAQVVK